MKARIFFILFCVSLFSLGTQAQGIQALFSYSTFASLESKPYVETHLLFSGSSLDFVQKKNGNYGATVEITMVFKKNDSIVYVSKRDLQSPEIQSPEESNLSFMDMQRIGLDNGIYNLEISLKDKNAKDSLPIKLVDKVILYYPAKQLGMADIQLLENLTPTATENILSKHGYDMMPYVDDYVPAKMNTLRYYTEVYNADKYFGGQNKPFSILVFIEEYLTGVPDKNTSTIKLVENAKPLNPIIGAMNIATLPSGNYNLVIRVQDSTGAILSYKKLFFQRNNPAYDHLNVEDKSFAAYYTSDSLLGFYIKTLDPIATMFEQNFIRHQSESASLEEKQAFFDGFWKLRNKENPAQEWVKYQEKVLVVEANFGFRNKPGYQTDMGIVYLKYGPPNYIIDEKFKSSDGIRNKGQAYLPYQMWRYDLLPGNKPKRMFVFWSRQFNTYDYELLNSNAVGEVTDPYWEQRLSRGTVQEGEVGYAGHQFERGY